MTIKKDIYENKHFIYYDSTLGYTPAIGDIVAFNPKTCEITETDKNICKTFGLARDKNGRSIENGDAQYKETSLGTMVITSKHVRVWNGTLSGEATTTGDSFAIRSEGAIEFSREEQSIFKFVEAKKITCGGYYLKEEMEKAIGREIGTYKLDCWYAVVYGQDKCANAYLYKGNQNDRVFNVGESVVGLRVTRGRWHFGFKSTKKISMTVSGRPNALVGIYIFPFKVSVKNGQSGERCESEITMKPRGAIALTPAESGDTNSSADEFEVRFDEEALERAKTIC